MFTSRFLAQVAVSFVLVLRANAESHIITFNNQCGFGTPALMQNGLNILTGNSYTSNAPWSGIAYLQTGYCNTNGENCTLLETTLINPTPGCIGCGSSTDLSLILPHLFSVTTSFAYYGGCDGQGKTCTSENCVGDAFFQSNDNQVQVACQTNDVNLLVAFCAEASQFVSGSAATSGSSSPLPTSSPPTLSSSLPPSSLPPPSSTPTLEASAPGSVPPVTPSAPSTPSTPTPTPTQTPTDDGCGSTEPATSTPTSTPTPTDDGCGSTGPATSAPTSTPALSPPTVPAGSAPPPASGLPTTTQNCRPRPTSLTPSNSAPTSPASAPTSTPSSTSTASAQLRRHRRAHRIRY